VLLGVTGGVAAYKAAYLARLLVAVDADVRAVLTSNASRFIGAETFSALTGNAAHGSLWEEPGSVLHVALARGSDVAIVAPATANVIARLAHGIADDLLTSTLLEATCPIVVAPAMHSGMWRHPATRANVETLVERGVRLVGPVEGALAAGDEGIGRMAEPEEVLRAAEAAVAGAGDLAGHRLVVTAGPTHEAIDPVRYIGNRSSGRMGVAVAIEAAARGADVHLVLGPGMVEPPPHVKTVRVETAEEMREAVLGEFEGSDAVVMAAAVSDFRPERAAEGKLKKGSGPPDVRLVQTPDILGELGAIKGDRVLVGFAAETENLEEGGRAKLAAKNLDFVVVNEVGRHGTGFGSETNDAMIISRSGGDEPLRTWTKRQLASAICDRLATLLADGR